MSVSILFGCFVLATAIAPRTWLAMRYSLPEQVDMFHAQAAKAFADSRLPVGVKDPWGKKTGLIIKLDYHALRSAGPDERWNTEDDVEYRSPSPEYDPEGYRKIQTGP